MRQINDRAIKKATPIGIKVVRVDAKVVFVTDSFFFLDTFMMKFNTT